MSRPEIRLRPPLYVMVCGGRDYSDKDRVDTVLNAVAVGAAAIVTGGARGADRLAEKWAQKRGIQTITMPANWIAWGKTGGPRRNSAIIDLLLALDFAGKRVVCVSFPGGLGTEDVTEKALRAHLRVVQGGGL